MSASSGITPPPDFATTFAAANASDGTRFLKVSIINESLVHSLIPAEGSFDYDLSLLHRILEDEVPAFVFARKGLSDWLAITYVPDAAKVRDKMLYASTSTSLVKAIGSSVLTDTLFANSKEDLTPAAYSAHKRHLAAPKPMSTREREMEDIRIAEHGTTYIGSRARANHLGGGVNLCWDEGAKDAVKKLGECQPDTLIALKIDSKAESLSIALTSETSIDSLGSTLSSSEPCYAFYVWLDSTTETRHIVFIYSCPSSSPVKDRMMYSSGVSSTYQAARDILLTLSPPVHLASRKIETSSPGELNEAFLRDEFGLARSLSEDHRPGYRNTGLDDSQERKPFAKPRGPGRRR